MCLSCHQCVSGVARMQRQPVNVPLWCRETTCVGPQIGMAMGSQPARSRQGSVVAMPTGSARALNWGKVVRLTQAVMTADQPAKMLLCRALPGRCKLSHHSSDASHEPPRLMLRRPSTLQWQLPA